MGGAPDLREALAADGSATLVEVLAQPRAGRTRVVGLHDGRVKIALAAPPVDGEANKALLKALAAWLGVPKGAVTLASGDTGRRKRVRVEGLGVSEVAQALAEAAR